MAATFPIRLGTSAATGNGGGCSSGANRSCPRDPSPDLSAVADPSLARALAQLDFDQRTVVVLRFHLDWSTDQIATALEIPPGTVKSRLHRGLRRLETLLKETR